MNLSDLQTQILFEDANKQRYTELLWQLADTQHLINEHKRKQCKVVQITSLDGRVGRLRLYPKYIEPLATDVKIEWFDFIKQRYSGFHSTESVEQIITEFKVFTI
jgi:hypothetical protein